MRFPWAVSIVAATLAASLSAVDRAPEVEWTVRPLLRFAEALPGGAHLDDVGETAYSKAGVLLYWGRVGKTWTLYSKSGDETRIVLTKGSKVPPPLAENISQNPGADPELGIWAGRGQHYVQARRGRLGNHFDVFAWDGERLRPLVTGGRLLSYGDTTYTVDDAWVESMLADGRAILRFTTERPRRLTGFALVDGAEVQPFLVPGEPLTGLPGVRSRRLSKWTSFAPAPEGRLVLNFPVFDQDRVVVLADSVLVRVDFEPEGCGLFRFRRDVAEKVVAVGDPAPDHPQQQITDVSPPMRIGDRVFLQLGVGPEGWAIYEYAGGSLSRLAQVPVRHPVAPERTITKAMAFDTSGGKEAVFFVAARQGVEKERPEVLYWNDGTFRVLARGETKKSYGLLGFGGGYEGHFRSIGFLRPASPFYAFLEIDEEVRASTTSPSYNTIRTQWTKTIASTLRLYDGHDVSQLPVDSVTHHSGVLSGWSAPRQGYIPADAPTLVFQPAPVLGKADGVLVDVLAVAGMNGDREAIVRTAKGMYLMTAP